MRIVVVKGALPWPPNQGTRRVSLLLLKALAAEHDVTLVTQYFEAPEAEDVTALERATGCRVVADRAPNRRSALTRAAYKLRYTAESLLGGHSPRVLYATPRTLRRAAARVTAAEPAELALFEYWYTYPAFPCVRARRRILLAHDAEFVVNQLAAERGHKLGHRSFWSATEARREREALQAVDRVWTLTSDDADALSAASGVPRDRFDLMPFGIDLGALDRASQGVPAVDSAPRVLFFGAFAADFNRDALDWLLREVWPAIRTRAPNAILRVAGSGLDAARRIDIEAAGGEYAGAVADVAGLYADAQVVLIPLRFGGGLRIRLLEALACRRAVVATPIGVGGLGGESGRHFEVAPDAAGLAQATAALLGDPARRARLGAAGRLLVEGQYAESPAIAGIRRLAREALGAAAAPPKVGTP